MASTFHGTAAEGLSLPWEGRKETDLIKCSLTGAERLARIPPPPGVAEHGVVVGGQDGAGVAPEPRK